MSVIKNTQQINLKDNSKELQELQEKIEELSKTFKRKKYISGWLLFNLKKTISKVQKKYEEKNISTIKTIGSGNEKLTDDDIKNMSAFENYLIGTDYNLKPVYVNNMNQHMTVFGATGSGKSVYLFNLLRQVLEKGGGCCMLDGKGDLNMFRDFKKFADDFGRTEDILVLNFNKGADSNSFNLFEALPLNDIENILKSIAVPEAKDFFASQALTYFEQVFMIIKYLKHKKRNVNLKTFEKLLDLKALILQKVPPSKEDPKKPDPDILKWNGLTSYADFWVEKEFYLDKAVVQSIISFIDQYGATINLEDPGDPSDYKVEISDQLQQQIGGYSAMTMKKITNLSNQFNNIFNNPTNDINFTDIIAQNKLVYVIIPKMRQDEETPNSIGAFLIAAIKNAVGNSLGEEVSMPKGLYYKLNKEQITSKPTFLLILDEMHAFVGKSKGAIKDLMAQARSVNISCIVSSQDISPLASGDGGEAFANNIFSNALTQVFLKIIDKPTVEKAKNIIMTSEKTIDNEGKEIKKMSEEDLATYLKKAKNGIGVMMSKDFERFLTPYVEPKSKDDEFEINR